MPAYSRQLLKPILFTLIASSAPLAVQAQSLRVPTPATPMQAKMKLGLEGYCPVCITQMKKWMKGSPAHQATYDGVTYYFPGDGPKQKFLKAPEKYVPALNGDCIACWAMAKKRVPGSVRHAALHRGRLYLFPSKKELDAFSKTPKKFENTDLALKGDCSVCIVMANKKVPGKTEFTAMHNGFRYLFPADNERQIFLRDPARYADKSLVPSKVRTTAMLTVTGKTSCAACTHGVNPLGAPDELGLAVTSADGTIFVIEDAHARWPSLYKARFDGKTVKVEGTVIKREGKFAWVNASDLVIM